MKKSSKNNNNNETKKIRAGTAVKGIQFIIKRI